jgi:hypothetical protein
MATTSQSVEQVDRGMAPSPDAQLKHPDDSYHE